MADLQNFLDLIRKEISGSSATRYQSRFQTSDIVQESAVQLISEFANCDSESPGQITNAWLKVVGRGNAAKLRRKNDAECRAVSKEVTLESDPKTSFASPEDSAEFAEVSASLVIAVARLDFLERKVIQAVYGENRSLASVAEELGCCKKKIQRVHTAVLDKLARSLKQSGVDRL